jgi:hypothetical protein
MLRLLKIGQAADAVHTIRRCASVRQGGSSSSTCIRALSVSVSICVRSAVIPLDTSVSSRAISSSSKGSSGNSSKGSRGSSNSSNSRRKSLNNLPPPLQLEYVRTIERYLHEAETSGQCSETHLLRLPPALRVVKPSAKMLIAAISCLRNVDRSSVRSALVYTFIEEMASIMTDTRAITPSLPMFTLSEIAEIMDAIRRVRNIDHLSFHKFVAFLTADIAHPAQGSCFQSASDVSLSLSALRRWQVDTGPGLPGLIAALTTKIAASDVEFSAEDWGRSLSGFKNIRVSRDPISTSDEARAYLEEVLALLCSVTDKLSTLNQPLTARAVSQGLGGLMHMDDKEPEVQSLLALIIPQIAGCIGKLTPTEIGSSIIGLTSMSLGATSAVRSLVSLLLSKMEEKKDWGFISTKTIMELARGLNKDLHFDQPECRALIVLLTDFLTAGKNETNSFVPNDLSLLLCLVQDLDIERKEVAILVSKITLNISQCKHTYGSESVSMSLKALHKFNSRHAEVRDLLAVLTKVVTACSEPATGKGVVMMLQGLTDRNAISSEVRGLVGAIAPLVSTCTDPLTATGVATALSAIKYLDDKHAEVRSLLLALTPLVSSCSENLTLSQAEVALSGLYSLSSDSPEALGLVAVLTPLVAHCQGGAGGGVEGGVEGGWESGQVVRVLLSLRGMDGSANEVRALLSAIAPKIASCTEGIPSDKISFVLQAFRRMLSNDNANAEVGSLLSALALNISLSAEPMAPRDIAECLFTFRGIKSNTGVDAEIIQVLSSITPRIVACQEPMSNDEISMALYGLQRMSSNSVQVRLLLRTLAAKVTACPDAYPMDAQAITSSLEGLRSMSSSHTEVRELISALVPKIALCTEQLTLSHVRRCLHALAGFKSNVVEVLHLLQVLTTKIKSCENKWYDGKPKNFHTIHKALEVGLYQMDYRCTEVRALFKAVRKLVGVELSDGSSSSASSSTKTRTRTATTTPTSIKKINKRRNTYGFKVFQRGYTKI